MVDYACDKQNSAVWCLQTKELAWSRSLEEPEVRALTLAPKNPLPYWQQLKAARSFIDGIQALVDAGGPVTRIVL